MEFRSAIAVRRPSVDLIPTVLNRDVFDDIVTVGDLEARDRACDLAQSEGIFCGLSSGSTFAAALKVAAKAPRGSVLLVMLPDTGERHLSTKPFEGINEASDEVWASRPSPCPLPRGGREGIRTPPFGPSPPSGERAG